MRTLTHHTAGRAEQATIGGQPMGVWAVTVASIFAFMGIGLVDPILPSIAENLSATQAQTSLLFTSYLVVTACMMLITGAINYRIGAKKTLLVGLAVIVVFACLSGSSRTVWELVGFRAGWGLGNALFAATALAAIVAVAQHGHAQAIILYEAGIGIGMATGPLLGAATGAIAWRAPFYATAVLMACAFVALVIMLPRIPKPQTTITLIQPVRALGDSGLFRVGIAALFYYCAFFAILAYTPFILGLNHTGIGLVFFGWGLCLALTSTIAAPRLHRRYGIARTTACCLVLFMCDMLVIAAFTGGGNLSTMRRAGIIAAVVASGAIMGVCNTLFTEMAMDISPVPQPVASAGYNFLRWLGGAAAAYCAPELGEVLAPWVPYALFGVLIAVSIVLIISLRRRLISVDKAEILVIDSAEPTVPDDVAEATQNGMKVSVF